MCPLCGFDILKIDNALPRCLHSQRIAVGFNETIDKIDGALGISEPLYGIVIEGAQISGAIILNEATDHRSLFFAIGKGDCGFQMLDNLRDRRAI